MNEHNHHGNPLKGGEKLIDEYLKMISDEKAIKATDIWNAEQQKGLKDFILLHLKKQSPERKLRNQVSAITI